MDTEVRVPCPECHGEGYCWEDAWDGEHYTREWRCPTCAGDGTVEGEPESDETEAA